MAAGKREKPTATVSVQDPKVKENTVVPGITVSRSRALMFGPVATLLRVNGRMESAMALVSSGGDDGTTEANGLRASRDGMVSDSQLTPRPNSRGPG